MIFGFSIPVVANFATTASDGKTYQVDHYNLDMIISVGYKSDDSMLLTNNTLVALALMTAESRTEEKDVMVKMVVNLINKNN